MNDLQKYINEIIDEKIDMESIIAAGVNEKLVKNTFGIKCPKCGSDQIHESERQTRSADEAATKIFVCLNCSHTWRKG